MTRVVEVPATFDDRSFEQFAGTFGAWPPEEKIQIDARGAQWSSPFGPSVTTSSDVPAPSA